jgi:hypothetical protein
MTDDCVIVNGEGISDVFIAMDGVKSNLTRHARVTTVGFRILKIGF